MKEELGCVTSVEVGDGEDDGDGVVGEAVVGVGVVIADGVVVGVGFCVGAEVGGAIDGKGELLVMGGWVGIFTFPELGLGVP